MGFRKFGQGEVTGADETYANVQQQREALRRQQGQDEPERVEDESERQQQS